MFLRSVPGETYRLYAEEHMSRDSEAEADLMSEDVMAHVHESGKPAHMLELKVGAIVQSLRNISFSQRVLNGTRSVVVKVLRASVDCMHMDGSRERVTLPRVTFEVGIPKSDVKIQRRQVPLRLCYSITSNKAQGKTFTGNVCVDMRRGFFGHGQAYVAMSRSKTADSLALLVNPHDVKYLPDGSLGVVFQNVLFPELLTAAAVAAPALLPPAPPTAPPPVQTHPDAVARGLWEYGRHPRERGVSHGPHRTTSTAVSAGVSAAGAAAEDDLSCLLDGYMDSMLAMDVEPDLADPVV
jgi:hypothetical protein